MPMNVKLILVVVCLFGPWNRGSAQLSETQVLRQSLGQIKDSLRYVDVLNRLAILMYETSVDSTFEYTIRARQLADRLTYEKGKADALNNLGIIYDIKGNPQLALRYYNDAHVAYTKLRDTVNRVQTAMNLAGVYKQLGNDKRAHEQFGTAFAWGAKLTNDSILSLVIYNYILLYSDQLSREEVTSQIKRAQRIATDYQDERTLIAIDQLVAEDLIRQGDRETGLLLLDSTINRAIRRSLFYVSMDMLLGMGDHLVAYDAERAAAYYRKSLTIAEQHHYLFYQQQAARRLVELYAFSADTTGRVYTQLLISLYDEQERLNNTSSIDYVDYAIQERQLEALATKSRYQFFLLVLAILVCLVALSAIAVIRRALRKTRRLNRQIAEQSQQMRRALTALEQSQASNTRIMQIVVHDLRNPIGAIGATASLLLEDRNRSVTESRLLELIRKSADDSLELVSDLLQVNAGTADMPKEPVDLDQMLRYCVDLLGSKAAAKAQHIELNSLPTTVFANREKLWRVISNLIANAIKFSPTGEKILVTLEARVDQVCIAVKDHGIGIPEEIAGKVFDLFTEARRPGTEGEQPFGLGLAISKQLVQAHHGRIWFESVPNQGTIFFVELPIR